MINTAQASFGMEALGYKVRDGRRRGGRLLCALALALALHSTGVALAASAGDPDDGPWVTDGIVDAVARGGGNTYIAGGFSSVGPRTGEAVPLSESSGQRLGSYPQVTQDDGSQPDAGVVNGHVQAAISDGGGGWYIGGGFTRVGGLVRDGLAHVRADMTVDPSFHPNANGTVYALALDGSTLYAGGDFTVIGGRARNEVAALNTATGAATSWDPEPQGGFVHALALRGSTLYMGGSFTRVAGQQRFDLAAVDPAGQLLPTPYVDSQVNALAISGSTLYLGGYFNTVGSSQRKAAAAIDLDSGQVLP